MRVIVFDLEDFSLINKMRKRLHNAEKAMTFDEQRDFAERLRLLLERGEPFDIPEK